MREDTKQRLDRAILLARLRMAAIAAATLIAVAIVLWWTSLNSTEEKIRVPGTVASVELSADKNVQSGLRVGITLDSGKHVVVLVNQITDPKVGQKVEITEHRYASGRRVYSWK